MQFRTVFIVSDRTGITAETLGHTLLTQFPGIEFQVHTVPFVDTRERALDIAGRINDSARHDGRRPLVFATVVDDDIRSVILQSEGLTLDLFEFFLGPLERELGAASSHTVGRSHGVVDPVRYTSRISAVNYSVQTDDGVSTDDYDRASLVIVGISRSGKTPTSLYLALHFSIFVANYPLTADDLDRGALPRALAACREKLFGLTIDPVRLQQIRQERRANSRYAELRQCQYEVAHAEALYRRERIPFLDTTSMSIEEISATIMHRAGIRRSQG